MIDISILKSHVAYASVCYLISSGDNYAVVDPSVSFEMALKLRFIKPQTVKYIIITHAHFDHILEIDSWVKATGAKVLIGEADRCALSDSVRNCYSLFLGSSSGYFGDSYPLSDNSFIPLGDDFIKVISLPGHTPGGIGLYFDGYLIVGDTVFASGFGRYDLPGGDIDALRGSIKRVLSYPQDTFVLPGHGNGAPLSTIIKYFSTFNL